MNKQKTRIIELAIKCIEAEYKTAGDAFCSSETATTYFKLQLHSEEREVLAVLFLDSKNKMIKFEKLFYGSINHSFVSVREIIKEALKQNAAAIILGHNHPSGDCKPSKADLAATKEIQKATKIMDIKLLDHVIVTKTECYSMTDHRQI